MAILRVAAIPGALLVRLDDFEEVETAVRCVMMLGGRAAAIGVAGSGSNSGSSAM
tara:strand:- start:225 stop:389 length:165 start_codon:yes stop_codon:yes gene_type:complete